MSRLDWKRLSCLEISPNTRWQPLWTLSKELEKCDVKEGVVWKIALGRVLTVGRPPLHETKTSACMNKPDNSTNWSVWFSIIFHRSSNPFHRPSLCSLWNIYSFFSFQICEGRIAKFKNNRWVETFPHFTLQNHWQIIYSVASGLRWDRGPWHCRRLEQFSFLVTNVAVFNLHWFRRFKKSIK